MLSTLLPFLLKYFINLLKDLIKFLYLVKLQSSISLIQLIITDKSMVANICTPEQRERFVDLVTEILSTYGGEGIGKEEKEETGTRTEQ